jgi:hypothetical protein
VTFGEKATGIWVAKLLLDLPTDLSKLHPFKSKVHGVGIKIEHWVAFFKDESCDCIEILRPENLIVKF